MEEVGLLRVRVERVIQVQPVGLQKEIGCPLF